MTDEVIFLDDGRVKINFTKSNEKYSFSDALNFTRSEYDALTEQDIENLKQQRFDKWYAIITHVPTEEEIAAQLAADQLAAEQLAAETAAEDPGV